MTHREFVRKSLAVPFVEKGRDFTGWDCYGLVFAYFHHVRGIDLPPYLGYGSTIEYKQLHSLIEAGKPFWEPVACPQQGDVALFNLSGRPTHLALVIDNRNALHAEARVGTFIEPMHGLVWGKRLNGIFRYANES